MFGCTDHIQLEKPKFRRFPNVMIPRLIDQCIMGNAIIVVVSSGGQMMPKQGIGPIMRQCLEYRSLRGSENLRRP
jgi:hypothetical protein